MKRTTKYYELRASAITHSICYATLSTVDAAGNPWNTPVSAVYDDNFNVYWFSDRESQHSRNVRGNGKVYIVIYNSTWPEGTGGQGLYLQSEACEVRDLKEIRKACRLKDPDRDKPERFMGDNIRRVYKASPIRMWINEIEMDGSRFIRDYRVEVALPKKRLS
jgi:hypothetical protein